MHLNTDNNFSLYTVYSCEYALSLDHIIIPYLHIVVAYYS